jgi:hypothetical protein
MRAAGSTRWLAATADGSRAQLRLTTLERPDLLIALHLPEFSLRVDTAAAILGSSRVPRVNAGACHVTSGAQ